MKGAMDPGGQKPIFAPAAPATLSHLGRLVLRVRALF